MAGEGGNLVSGRAEVRQATGRGVPQTMCRAFLRQSGRMAPCAKCLAKIVPAEWLVRFSRNERQMPAGCRVQYRPQLGINRDS
jgi:hypothetical protein